MSERRHGFHWVPFLAIGLLTWAMPALAKSETGKIHVYARPVEAEIFVDGAHMGNASWNGTLIIKNLSPGDHTVSVYNTGYTTQVFKVTVEGGTRLAWHVLVEPCSGYVNSCCGR